MLSVYFGKFYVLSIFVALTHLCKILQCVPYVCIYNISRKYYYFFVENSKYLLVNILLCDVSLIYMYRRCYYKILLNELFDCSFCKLFRCTLKLKWMSLSATVITYFLLFSTKGGYMPCFFTFPTFFIFYDNKTLPCLMIL